MSPAESSYVAYGPDLGLAVNGGVLTASSQPDGQTAGANDSVQRTGYRYHSNHGWSDGSVKPIGCYFWSGDAPAEIIRAAAEWRST